MLRPVSAAASDVVLAGVLVLVLVLGTLLGLELRLAGETRRGETSRSVTLSLSGKPSHRRTDGLSS